MIKLIPSRSSLMLMAAVVFLLCVMTSIAASAQTFATLFSFDGTDGSNPYGSLIQGTNGNFYGATANGGAHGKGTIFEMTPTGKLTTLYSFCSQSSQGFCIDGSGPYELIQATNGNFYGTTSSGGTNGGANAGTVFEITPAGKLTTLCSFCNERNSQGYCTDGEYPSGGLVQATNGDLYGTTGGGGPKNWGTFFEITPAGKLTTLHNFCSQSDCTDGGPGDGLVQATDGYFYGTTPIGGVDGGGGTVFKITPAGAFTSLVTFDGTDGSFPQAGLVQATNGNFYGTTSGGGANSEGTAYEITPGGTLTLLYSFCSQDYPVCTDGLNPRAGLVQATNGNFYGTTVFGGTSNDGTIYSLSIGLGPFVETNPTSGKVGSKVTILGNNLKITTSVTFNGTAVGSFAVNSSGSAIMTTVPTGATTGEVEVTTNTGTLESKVAFRIP